MFSKVARNLYWILLVAFIAFGCGDSGKGGSSGGSSSNPVVGLVDPGLGGSGSTALTAATAWYSSTAEATNFIGTTLKTETRSIKIYNPATGCTPKPITVFGLNLGNFSVCSSSNSVASTTSSTKSIMPVQNGAAKSTNSKLAALFSGGLGTLTNVIQSNGSWGVVYTFQITKTNGYQLIYVIDSGINSAFNPVYIMDTETRTEETLTNII